MSSRMVFDHNNHSNEICKKSEIELVGSLITKRAAFNAHTRTLVSQDNKRETRIMDIKILCAFTFRPIDYPKSFCVDVLIE